jgi:hypothetical protein
MALFDTLGSGAVTGGGVASSCSAVRGLSRGLRAGAPMPERARCDDWEIELTLGDDVRVARSPYDAA